MDWIGPKSILHSFFFWRVVSKLCFLALTISKHCLFAKAMVFCSTFRTNSIACPVFCLSVMFLSSLRRNSRIRWGSLFNPEKPFHLKILNLTTLEGPSVMWGNMYRSLGIGTSVSLEALCCLFVCVELKQPWLQGHYWRDACFAAKADNILYFMVFTNLASLPPIYYQRQIVQRQWGRGK